MMIRFKDIVDSKCGIRSYFEALELSSGFSRKMLLEMPMMLSSEEIRASFVSVLEAVRIVEDASLYGKIIDNLHTVRDISLTLSRLEGGETLDEIELFEIKRLTLVSDKVRRLLASLALCSDKSESCLPVPEDLSEALRILDPDGLHLGSFYIYDSYSPVLASLRAGIRKSTGEQRQRAEIEAAALEGRIRASICASLKPFAASLNSSLTSLCRLDIVIAKAKMMEDNGYVIPKVLDKGGKGEYEGLFHPQIADRLAAEGKEFQPVDFSFSSNTTIVVGMNMGGKSVLLKMLAMAQYLVQFGFAVPATSARVAPKENVFLISGDAEMTAEGLSSFAGEMKSLSAAISYVRGGHDALVLADEPARTTNPIEGTALVTALAVTLSELNAQTVIATHYDIGGIRCRQLRVKGYVDGKMDYSLADVDQAGVPHEAIDTARRIGADARWLELARRYADNR